MSAVLFLGSRQVCLVILARIMGGIKEVLDIKGHDADGSRERLRGEDDSQGKKPNQTKFVNYRFHTVDPDSAQSLTVYLLDIRSSSKL